MRLPGKIAASLLILASLSGCHSIDDDRIPPVPVYITFATQADWITYGVPGALQYRQFIKSERIPGDYPWSALTQTGFGGVLLVCDVNNTPRAYDLACPVECKANIRVYIDKESNRAVCPVCGSEYDVFSAYGYPLEGPAANDGYALTHYAVGPGAQNEYMIITR